MTKAKILTMGSVRSNAPSRGKRWESSATATMTAAEIVAFTIVHHMILILEDGLNQRGWGYFFS